LSHFDARICVPHCNMRKCSSHSDDMVMCDVCLCSSQCDVTNHIARTWLCSSHCDVNLCFSHCDVTMFNILQCYYVHQIITLLCSSLHDVTIFNGLQHYYVLHVVTFSFVRQIVTSGYVYCMPRLVCVQHITKMKFWRCF
jgi:hypothetical protein